MPIPGLNADKCAQRNRLAARRDGVDAVPMRLLRERDANPKTHAFAREDTDLAASHGELPADDTAALALINALCPDGSAALTLDDVYIHYVEAANSNFIADRFVFLDTTTLQNIATDAQAGFAFMNSHKTGGLSHDSELPFGKTFCGRYEMGTDEGERALLGLYLLRAVKPNGDSGPSTDDLHRMIDGGTVADVSVGLYGGTRVCDVCGNELYAYDRETGDYLCPHAPGTHRGMSKEQVAAQTERGVPGGVASYSLVECRCGEVSAVYDGAVPGAGFRKALALSRKHALSTEDSRQARASYATLLSKGDFPVGDDIIQAIKDGFASLKSQFTRPTEDAPPPAVPPKTDADLAANTTQDKLTALETRTKELAEQLEATKAEKRAARLTEYKRLGKLTPASDAMAAKLMEADEATFTAFLEAQGNLAAFAAPDPKNKDKQNAQNSMSGTEVAANLQEAGDADNSVLHNLALARCKQDGTDAKNYKHYSDALLAVSRENPGLVQSNRDALPQLG